MAKPIRRSLLIHTVEYLGYKGEDDTWGGNDNYKPPVTIERVRIESKKTVVMNSNGDSVVMQTLLFHDAVHSTPVTFKEKSKVILNGKEMTVSKVSDFYDRSNLHHVEVLLV
ncbi:minor capsid protein [Bacillus sp. AFS023182]|uniref:putative minor capsid protein n=1 Tax=Bacillus sp. AFS023182 TaxID=2033492 RepID=UPI000BF9E510|nr:putative minor capsid protein [Bacillus sp. AFS023182]PFD98918.1 minor capsid protein [Bacillus sp. AFS023182]